MERVPRDEDDVGCEMKEIREGALKWSAPVVWLPFFRAKCRTAAQDSDVCVLSVGVCVCDVPTRWYRWMGGREGTGVVKMRKRDHPRPGTDADSAARRSNGTCGGSIGALPAQSGAVVRHGPFDCPDSQI